jgi:chloride channel 7
VQYWANAAAGAGVTLVMAYLNGNHIPNLLRFSTLITKFVGTICSVSAGLPMGPEVGATAPCSCQAGRKTNVSCMVQLGGVTIDTCDVGVQGPMVHIGACVASVITYFDFSE